MADFYIRVGQIFDPTNQTSFDPTTYTVCHYQSTAVGQGETRMFNCPEPIEGRYVTVHFSADKAETLTLCEVVVYGEPAAGKVSIRGHISYSFQVNNQTE